MPNKSLRFWTLACTLSLGATDPALASGGIEPAQPAPAPAPPAPTAPASGWIDPGFAARAELCSLDLSSTGQVDKRSQKKRAALRKKLMKRYRQHFVDSPQFLASRDCYDTPAGGEQMKTTNGIIEPRRLLMLNLKTMHQWVKNGSLACTTTESELKVTMICPPNDATGRLRGLEATEVTFWKRRPSDEPLSIAFVFAQSVSLAHVISGEEAYWSEIWGRSNTLDWLVTDGEMQWESKGELAFTMFWRTSRPNALVFEPLVVDGQD